jgi:DNA-binding NtrC family response regulator
MATPVPISLKPCAKARPSLHSASQIMGVPSDPNGAEAAQRRFPADILIVEDNYIIALDLETMLRDLGVASIRTANSVREAIDLIVAMPPEFGLIDVNLGEDKSFDVAEQLYALGIPFAFTTGYGDSYAFPPHFAEMRIMTKPYTLEALRELFDPGGPPAPI